jgi:hypothetical protein
MAAKSSSHFTILCELPARYAYRPGDSKPLTGIMPFSQLMGKLDHIDVNRQSVCYKET